MNICELTNITSLITLIHHEADKLLGGVLNQKAPQTVAAMKKIATFAQALADTANHIIKAEEAKKRKE